MRVVAGVGHVFAARLLRGVPLRAVISLEFAAAQEYCRSQILSVAGHGRAARVDLSQDCRNPLQCFTIGQPGFVDDQDVSFFDLGDHGILYQAVVQLVQKLRRIDQNN